MDAYWLQVHPKEQHIHGDEIIESLVDGVVANSLAVEHLEIWKENGHMMGGFLETKTIEVLQKIWMFQRETGIGV